MKRARDALPEVRSAGDELVQEYAVAKDAKQTLLTLRRDFDTWEHRLAKVARQLNRAKEEVLWLRPPYPNTDDPINQVRMREFAGNTTRTDKSLHIHNNRSFLQILRPKLHPPP